MENKVLLIQEFRNDSFMAVLKDGYTFNDSVVVEAKDKAELDAKIAAAVHCDADSYIWRYIHGHPVRIKARANLTPKGGAKGGFKPEKSIGRGTKRNKWSGKKAGKYTNAKGLGFTDVSDADKSYTAQGVTGKLKGDLLTHMIGKNGKLKPERELLHRSIVKKHLEGVKKPEGQPTMTFLGGGSAAGKSTFTKNSKTFPKKDEAVSVDSDGIKGMLPEYKHMVKNKNSYAAGYAHEESSALAKRVMKVAQDQGYNVVLDGTGDNSVNSMMKKINQAREAGMYTKAEYCTVPTEVALERARARAAKTGREIKADVIKNIHRNVSQIVPKIIGEFDECNVWNTEGKTPILLASCKRGEKPTIHNQKLWEEFLAKGDE